MPRIYTSRNDPLDFCLQHFPVEEVAEQRYGHLGDGPDGRGNCFAYDAEHPWYEGDYKCVICKRPLTRADTIAPDTHYKRWIYCRPN